MAFQAVYLEALDGDVAVRYVGLAGQEKPLWLSATRTLTFSTVPLRMTTSADDGMNDDA